MPTEAGKFRTISRTFGLSILAVFPDDLYNERLYGKKMVTCYEHIGQHSGCTTQYLKGKKLARPEQYADLQKELENIGYNLNILN